MASGHILILNGTSSSGKSTIAAALQAYLRERERIYYLFQGDLMRDMHPDRQPGVQRPFPTLETFLPAIPECVAAIASHGNNVLVDDCISPWQLKNYVQTLRPFEVLYAGIRCSPEELLRREKARDERRQGAALGLARTVYLPGIFDVEVDTSLLTVEQCVERIVERLDSGEPGDAFRRLAGCDLDTVIEEAKVKRATLEIANLTTGPITAYRLDFQKQRQKSRDLAAGESCTQETANIYDWEIRDSADSLLFSFRPNGTPQRAIVRDGGASTLLPLSEG